MDPPNKSQWNHWNSKEKGGEGGGGGGGTYRINKNTQQQITNI